MDSSQEKSLPASERKLQKARQDGQGARSRDLAHLAILGAGAACLMMLAPQLMARLQLAMSQQLAFDASTVMAPGHMLSRLQDMVAIGLIASTVFALLTGGAA
ncbi:MAG: EscU/YscU/HrcU family type III secretion system export apparatus switch protein, partial [Acidovorax sp.]